MIPEPSVSLSGKRFPALAHKLFTADFRLIFPGFRPTAAAAAAGKTRPRKITQQAAISCEQPGNKAAPFPNNFPSH